tara:strand:+ start:7930 stop:8487 length:558 start_codon:yes stop_codon:yes gene_type:complete
MASIKKVAFSNQHSSLEDVEEYYVDSEDSLNHYFITSGSVGGISARFIGYTKKEIGEELKTRKDTLDRACSLELLAAIEAKFRVDYLLRCQNKKKDYLSKRFRAIHRKKANRASLEDDIISTWKKELPEHKTRLDHLGKALDYRNWLAHGRYWQPKKHPHISQFDYLTIFNLATDILTNIDFHEG